MRALKLVGYNWLILICAGLDFGDEEEEEAEGDDSVFTSEEKPAAGKSAVNDLVSEVGKLVDCSELVGFTRLYLQTAKFGLNFELNYSLW